MITLELTGISVVSAPSGMPSRVRAALSKGRDSQAYLAGFAASGIDRSGINLSGSALAASNAAPTPNRHGDLAVVPPPRGTVLTSGFIC